MLNKIRIALISDLHIGREAVSVDLCPHQIDPSKEVGMEREFLRKLETFLASDEFKKDGPIDALCVTGDISDRADPIEFILADKILKQLADALNLSLDSIFFVPGNHDVHWPVMKLDPASFWANYRYEPLLQKDLLFRQRLTAAHDGAFHESPHYAIWKTSGCLIVGINSAAFDDPKPADGKHHGLINQDTLEKLENALVNIPYEPNQLRVCLLHHHPINYSDFQPEYADFSAATNAGNLFNLLSAHNFDLMMHGHKHVPQLNHWPAANNGHPMTILGAGSLSAQISTEWCGLAQNQFHVIEVVGRDPKNHAAFGNVATWNFVGRKWCEGESRFGLAAKEGFGTLSTAMELEQEIFKALKSVFDSGASYCKWNRLEKEMPAIAYVNTKAAFAAINKIAKTNNYTFVGDANSKKLDWIILHEGNDHG
jgi:3',5'-cyclic AMP phosphodiesterase CpdA